MYKLHYDNFLINEHDDDEHDEIQLHVCGQIIFVCNSEITIKIRQYLPKLCSNEKRSSFSDSQCSIYYASVPKSVCRQTASWMPAIMPMILITCRQLDVECILGVQLRIKISNKGLWNVFVNICCVKSYASTAVTERPRDASYH